jgi:hypothetical protein
MNMDIANLETSISLALDAVGTADERAGEAQMLRDLSLRAKKLHRALGRPQALGLFGPSQAGKSFLIGALLSHELGSLHVRGRTEQLDFLKEINPAKGVESTGVVTRFSSQTPSLQRGEFFCRLLTLDALLEALATGFFVECNAAAIDVDKIDRCLREARAQAGTAVAPRYRLAWETALHNLAKRYQDRHPHLNVLKAHREIATGSFATAVTTRDGWSQVYSLLWGGRGAMPDLDALFMRLFDGLEALGHCEGVELESAHVRASSKEPSLIDASCLNALGHGAKAVRVTTQETGASVELDPGVLSALIAEIVLPLTRVAGSLLDKADILDFPGGRALKGLNGFGVTELSTGKLENAIEVYKRGKLTFLFEQFAVDREITSLLLCSPGPTKPEAIQLQSQVENWLRVRHGADVPNLPEEIEQPSLFLALTKFDMSLGALRSDNARDRWESRVQEACIDFWARSHNSWLFNWGQKGRNFDNLFWIRNPHADQMQSLRSGSADYIEVKNGYLTAKAVARHIREPEVKWAAVDGDDPDLGLPRSGIPLLARALNQKLAVNMKANELAREAEAVQREFAVVLRALTPSRDENELRQRKLDNAKALTTAIEQEMSVRSSGAVFARFVATLAIPHHEVVAEVRKAWDAVSPLSIKSSDKVKRLLVTILRFWQVRAASRLRESGLPLPHASIDAFLRELCTSKQLLPVLGSSLFPYVSRKDVDTELLATIFELKITDGMLDLFVRRPRRTPSEPVVLSYAERAARSTPTDPQVGDVAGIDWTDVSFDEQSPPPKHEVVFAGRARFAHFEDSLGAFYLRNDAQTQNIATEDPRTLRLSALLAALEGRA